MAYTVKEVSKISGVSVRTLHFYDEVGLLQPAYYGENGYRYYEEDELLLLQQILFFRELGFSLEQIKKVLKRSDFDKTVALNSHKLFLQKKIKEMRKLINTIDKTIKHLQGNTKMNVRQFYEGFTKEEQAQHEKELIERFGEKAKVAIAESHKKVAKWTKSDWMQSDAERDSICRELAKMIEMKRMAESDGVQKLIQRHYQWVKTFWSPTKETFALLGDLYVEWDEKTKQFSTFHPELATFFARAMKIFAEQNL